MSSATGRNVNDCHAITSPTVHPHYLADYDDVQQQHYWYNELTQETSWEQPHHYNDEVIILHVQHRAWRSLVLP